eukprot:c11089_g1_i1.p1 GENE.c11089_g1_i1~~c11089_g1_i1.p1  ORF type:complete len:295 (-),score=54.96 c11089_g1_i1:50-934(-)
MGAVDRTFCFPMLLVVLSLLPALPQVNLPQRLSQTTGCDPQPSKIIVERETIFAALFNAQDFDLIEQIFYNPGAQLIPPSADSYLLASQVPAFLKSLYDSGVRNLALTPVCTVTIPNGVIHELGEASSNQGSFKYYVRWIPSDVSYQIAFDVTHLNVSESALRTPLSFFSASDVTPSNDINNTIANLDHAFAELFNSQQFDQVQQLYTPDALLVPPTADEFINQPSYAMFFKSVYESGAKNLQLFPQHVLQESDTLVHEIGHLSHALGGGTYYARWRAVGSTWKIEFDLMSIGA